MVDKDNTTTESRQKFGSQMLIFTFSGYMIFMVLSLLEGDAGQAWIAVLSIILAQFVLSTALGLLISNPKYFNSVNLTLAVVNFVAQTAIIIIVGGYPTHLWVMALFGIFPSTFFLGRTGVFVNAALAGLALAIPHLNGLDTTILFGIGAQVITLLILGWITELSFSLLLREQHEHKEKAVALREANIKLTAALTEQEQQVNEVLLLNEMSDLLQACYEIEETYPIIDHYMNLLFPSASGALSLYSSSRDSLESTMKWGELMDKPLNPFPPTDCWALRRGQVHESDTEQGTLCCQHIHESSFNGRVLCVPLMAQGEVLGVLHLQNQMDGPSGNITMDVNLSRLRTESLLVRSVTKQIALTFTNLHLRETLRNQSIRDALTGLFNRRYLEETLEREIYRAKRRQNPMAVIMLDIDHFKQFNDLYGHEAGDVVLREFGMYLSSHMRQEDIACRYGGEEFVLILPDSSLKNGFRRADELRIGLSQLVVTHRGKTLGKITASLGVSAIPETEAGDLIRAADSALYEAKTGGRNKVVSAK